MSDTSEFEHRYWHQMIANAQNEGAAIDDAAKPSRQFKPRIFMDGDKWCVLYGDNLQEGVAGFGDSPAEAMAVFDTAWAAKLIS